jgi:hypothetical protein
MNERRAQRSLAATLYPIEGLETTRYRFRILRVRERIPEDDLRPIRMQRWADKLWRRELRCPVYPTTRFGFPGFLISDADIPLVGKSIEITDVPDKLYHIDVIDQLHEASSENAAGVERDLICRMLERPFTDRFRSLKEEFWKAEWTLFFRMIPENETTPQDIVNAYRGLKFGVILVEGRPSFAADVRTRYVGRKSLAGYTEEEKQHVLQDHLDLTMPVKDRASFIRDNGPMKMPCRYTGESGTTVGKCTFDETGETVFEYYRKHHKTVQINPDEAAVFAQDRVEEGQSRPVPISRLFPVFTTEYEGLRACSIRPQMTPEERVSSISKFLNYFRGVKYGETSIHIESDYVKNERTVFLPPRLEFGKGEILEPFPKGIPPKTSGLFDSLTVKWGSRKLPTLYKSGPYHNEPLPDVVLLYPNTIDRPMRETFLKDLSQEIQIQTNQQLRIVQQRSYPVGQRERMGSSLLNLATEVRSSNPRCLSIVVLWDRFSPEVHGELKDTIKPVLSQCATEKTIRSICNRSDPQRATSQVRNLALAVLTEGGVKPWVLADSLYHDLTIGIDVLFGKIGYHFLYGTGGRLIDRQFGETVSRGRASEAIKEPVLRRRLEESIRSIVKNGHQIRTFIIHRDGRWWPGESAALHRATDHLIAEKCLPPDVRCAAVEIRKNHMPIRLFTLIENEENRFLQNPLPGTYLILDRQRVVLTTTGRPGAWDRRGITAGTLLLEIVDSIGTIDIGEVAEDVYRLSHLNWNAPDIEIGAPVSIRWTDESLRETFRSPSEKEEEEAEWDKEPIESEDINSLKLEEEVNV